MAGREEKDRCIDRCWQHKTQGYYHILQGPRGTRAVVQAGQTKERASLKETSSC